MDTADSRRRSWVGATDVSVIVAARNAEHTIEAQLVALRDQHWDGSWEVIVVDNGSGDDTVGVVERVARSWPRLHVVTARERRGPSYARNVGADLSIAHHLLFCDADDVVGADWLASMASALRTGAVVAGGLEYDELNPAWLTAVRGTSGT